ncbi:MAG: T9SS type A sorting domain-containing protein [Bacteroidota bacterium]
MIRSRLLFPMPLLLLLPSLLFAQEPEFNPYPEFNSGNMRMIISMKGQMGNGDVSEQQHGLFWPGEGVSNERTRGLCFSATPVVTGRIGAQQRVSASYYRDNFRTGPILSGKPVTNPTDPFFRAYKVTWQENEETDYRDWPVELGAPVAADGSPLFYGKSQMYWLMNDLDSTASRLNNGCDPMGLEMRCLLYAPWEGDARDNTLLLQVTYINKGGNNIEDAYAGFFMDTDLRDPLNDLAGSDSARGMVYAYQGSVLAEEEGMPAALGIVMLQTPAVAAPGDSARWFAGWKSGARNIPVTAAVVPFKTLQSPISEPRVGFDDTELWAALMQGKGKVGNVINPVTGAPSSFWYSGDPVSGSGWLPRDGIRLSDGQTFSMNPRDQRMLISAGPFNLAPGDTQQVTYAFIAARGASPEAAVHELRDRAEFRQADFHQRPAASAYRSTAVRPPSSTSTSGAIEVNARVGENPVDLRVEVSDARGVILADELMDRFASQNEWVYRKTVTLPQPQQDGVNVSFISEWNGESVRIPGRVSVPIGGSVDLEGIEMLEEGDGNGRVSREEDAKWFPRFVNHSSYGYDVFAQSFAMPNDQWLNVPDLAAQSTFPNEKRPWSPSAGYNYLWDKTLAIPTDSIAYRYDVFDPSQNVWWERQNWVSTDSMANEWYDVLMTQVRGASDERPGVRLLDLGMLQDKWYVATIDGAGNSRTLSLHDSASGVPYFSDYGLDIFTGAVPPTDGFRIVRGTISKPGVSVKPVTAADLFIFNPRHVLLARSQKPAVATATVSKPSPMPLTEWTSVRVELPESTTLRAEVYNLIGQRVKVLRDEVVPAGRHLLVWDGYWSDGRAAESGMYLLRIAARGSEVTRKIIVVR